MKNMQMEKVVFDYYGNTPSYLKTIVDMMPENKVSNEKKYIIKEIYNYYLNHTTESKINEITTISGLFNEKISISDVNVVINQVEYIYANFVNRIIFDSINRDKLFDIMNECIKVFVGYYDLCNMNNYDSNKQYVNSFNRSR